MYDDGISDRRQGNNFEKVAYSTRGLSRESYERLLLWNAANVRLQKELVTVGPLKSMPRLLVICKWIQSNTLWTKDSLSNAYCSHRNKELHTTRRLEVAICNGHERF